MPTFVIESTERSIIESNAPAAASITTAMQSVNLGGGNWGGWVGPSPRITRRAAIADAFYTTVAWLYQWPDGDWYTQHGDYMRQTLVSDVTGALASLSSDWTAPTLVPYTEAAHGTLLWWQSGAASQTSTRDVFPTGTMRLDPADGPDSPTQSGGADVKGLITAATWLIGIGGVVYLLTAIVPHIKDASADREARRSLSPSRYRRIVRRRM